MPGSPRRSTWLPLRGRWPLGRSRRLLGAGLVLLIAAGVGAVLLAGGGGGSPHGRGAGSAAGSGLGFSGPTASGPAASGGPSTTPTTSAPLAGASPPAGSPARLPPAGQQFGVNVNRLFNDRTYTRGEIDAQLEAVHRTGATIARSDALWEAAEPAAPENGVHRYDWSFDDLIAGSLASHGLRWLAILDYTAIWDQSVPGQDHSAPRSTSDFAAFAAAFAARYGAGGSFWGARPELKSEAVNTYEIWNEPDNQEFWIPSPNAAAYVELYLAARDAITAVDPSGRVIVGGLTNPGAFLPAMVHARPELVGHVDGVAIHPYGANPLVVFDRVRGARAALTEIGMPTVPLYVTETGWTTSPPHSLSWASERSRPGYIAATLDTLGHTNCEVAATVLYTWVTPEQDPSNHEDWFGIHPPHGGSSVDTDAFAAGLQKAAEPAPPVSLCSG